MGKGVFAGLRLKNNEFVPFKKYDKLSMWQSALVRLFLVMTIDTFKV